MIFAVSGFEELLDLRDVCREPEMQLNPVDTWKIQFPFQSLWAKQNLGSNRWCARFDAEDIATQIRAICVSGPRVERSSNELRSHMV